MEQARKLAASWIDAWNNRDLPRLLDMYDLNVTFSSPRVAVTFKRAGVGSANGVIRGIEGLASYFKEAIDNLKVLHLSLDSIMEGTEGKHALLYTRETGAKVIECHTVDQTTGKITAVEVFYDTVV